MGIGNIRFDKLMLNDAKILEQAIVEGWKIPRVAKKLDVDTDSASSLLAATREASEVVDAKNFVEAFRSAIRQVIQHSLRKGLIRTSQSENS
ncbi:MAG: hypothetical protein FJ267_10105 [Planctomycetes bacterium]|nr:hypothetical protein [Planctomycetota bacterium]